jgi:lipoprotein-releasing system ATP-binding protein
MAIVEARELTKRYHTSGTQPVDVFSGLSLSIDAGELVALTGPSGSGKSTLLHLLGTLDRATSGEIKLAGNDVQLMSDKELSDFRNKTIGFIFQFHHLLPEFTAVENVAMPALIAGKTLKEVTPRAKQLLEEVGLSHRGDHRPAALSGGESQRVAVARAFIMESALILADEPTGNLDQKNSDALFDLILGLSRHHSQTFLMATHNLELAKRADRTLHLEFGKLS